MLLFAVIDVAEAHSDPISLQDIYVVDGNPIAVHSQRAPFLGASSAASCVDLLRSFPTGLS